MNILLTGATGYLGRHLAGAFVATGHKVAVLTRCTSDLSSLANILPELALYELEQGGLANAFHDIKFDVIVHTATCYGRSDELVVEVFTTNTAWPLQLLETAASAGVPLFINTDTSLDRFINSYALAKKQFREWGYLFAGQERIRFVNVVLEHFYGSGDLESKFVTQIVRRCLRNEPEIGLTAGTQRRDFIYIDDVVAAYLLLVKDELSRDPAFQEYGLGSGVSVPVRDLVIMVKSLAGSDINLNFGAVPLRHNEVMDSQANIIGLRSLGWQPHVSLVDGLAQTIKKEKELMERTTI
jgi:nucleoside-diphosphate-sugar epimerase